jgi:branched-chain amino acid transport system ATP-binding protein
MMPEGRAVLVVRSLSVGFGGVAALDQVDLDVHPGEIVGLVGPNGAGKSTLVNCVGGQLEPSSGSLLLGAVDLGTMRPFQRARLGIGRTFQRVALFPELTVEAHLLASLRAGRRGGRWWELLARAQPTTEESRAIEETLGLLGLSGMAGAPVATLPLGACRMLELGRALIGQPRVLLADEPSSGLDRWEASRLASVLRLAASRGIGILLVEHDLGLVASACDRVVVLDLGRVIATGRFVEVMADPAVRRAYLGEAVA